MIIPPRDFPAPLKDWKGGCGFHLEVEASDPQGRGRGSSWSDPYAGAKRRVLALECGAAR
jgi:hypothetical protein